MLLCSQSDYTIGGTEAASQKVRINDIILSTIIYLLSNFKFIPNFNLFSVKGTRLQNSIYSGFRTYRDMTLHRLMQGEENFSMKLIVREWNNIAPEYE